MTFLDKLLQQWRMRKAMHHIPAQCRLLDIGCHEGEMFKWLKNHISEGIGIDPLAKNKTIAANIHLFNGYFPAAISNEKPFDAITALALVEHIPQDELQSFFANCYHYLNPGGVFICTIPHPRVDEILKVLMALKLVKGMSLEEHHGFDVKQTPELATAAGFQLQKASTFQFGLNHLFVFCRPL